MNDAPDQPVGDVVGVIEHYAAFIKLCRLRIEQLGLTFESVDALCGFPLRYTAKLLSESKGMSGYTLFTLARGLALLPAFHHDEEQHAKLQRHSEWISLRRPGPRWRKRGSTTDSSTIKLYPDFLHKRAQAGGLARAQKLSRKRRRDSARNAVRNRKWRPVRDKQNGGGSI